MITLPFGKKSLKRSEYTSILSLPNSKYTRTHISCIHNVFSLTVNINIYCMSPQRVFIMVNIHIYCMSP